jgi:hypothetical protein
MEQSVEITELTAALVKAKGAFKPLTPDKVNPHFKSRYASLQQCYEVTDAALLANGLTVTQWLEPAPDGMMALTTQIQHVSGQWQRSTGYLPTADTPQAGGSSLTYLRRYGIAPALGIAPDEDDDGNVAQQTTAERPRQSTAPTNGQSEYVFGFGKYKGKSVSQVWALGAEGHSYLHWFSENANNKNEAASVRQFLDRQKQQAAKEDAPDEEYEAYMASQDDSDNPPF